MSQKKILMIAFIYPPLGGSGVQRSLKFTKYLPQFGWQPYVVCSDEADVFQAGWDDSLLAEVPAQARVWRRSFVHPLGLRRRVQKRFGVAARSLATAGSTGQEPRDKSVGGGGEPLSLRTLRALTAPLAPIEFPPVDAALYWALAILPGCLRRIRREKIDLIFSTSFPYSDHVTGYCLKKLTGLPWVADFRDPWTQNASARNAGWRFQVDGWTERRVLHTADRIIGVTPAYTEGLRRLAPERAATDFVTIENGYDGVDFMGGSADEGRSTPEVIELAHVGKLYNGTALPLLKALERLGEAGDRLRVRFIGGLAEAEAAWLAEHPLSVELRIEGRIPHEQAVRYMRDADALLLLIGEGQAWMGHYPGKLFEYMASGKPILLIGPEGEAAGLVRRSGTGCTVRADDEAAILEALRLLIEQPEEFRRRYHQPRREVIAAYERRALAHRLAEVFDELAREA